MPNYILLYHPIGFRLLETTAISHVGRVCMCVWGGCVRDHYLSLIRRLPKTQLLFPGSLNPLWESVLQTSVSQAVGGLGLSV